MSRNLRSKFPAERSIVSVSSALALSGSKPRSPASLMRCDSKSHPSRSFFPRPVPYWDGTDHTREREGHDFKSCRLRSHTLNGFSHWRAFPACEIPIVLEAVGFLLRSARTGRARLRVVPFTLPHSRRLQPPGWSWQELSTFRLLFSSVFLCPKWESQDRRTTEVRHLIVFHKPPIK